MILSPFYFFLFCLYTVITSIPCCLDTPHLFRFQYTRPIFYLYYILFLRNYSTIENLWINIVLVRNSTHARML